MKQPTPWWMWLLPLPVVWWAALLTAGAWQPGTNLLQLSTALQRPWDIRWTQYSGRCLLLFTLAYAVGIGMALSNTTATRRGEEHGSARWGDVFSIARRYRDKRGGNLILTQHFSIGWDGYRHKHNINVLVVGGSGAGKTRGYCVPNILEAAGRDQNAPPCSIVCSDPKSEVLRKTGALLIARGYEVRVLDLTSPAASFCYNPLRYIQSDKDALRMIDTLIQATTPPDSKSSDPFWVKSETALLQALVLYLVHEAPEEEQNLPMVMEMLQAAEVREEDDEYESPLDMLFSRLEMRDPESIALKQYRVYKMAAGKTAKSILVSVGVRLSAFLLPEVAKMTCTDELHLEELGEKKVALFCCIPDSEKSLNYLVGLMYGQLVKALGGEVLPISPHSSIHLNALDIDRAYGEGKNPLVDKVKLVLSVFEPLTENGLTAKQRSILDRCARLVYREYIRGGYRGAPPTLVDLRRVLLEQPEAEAHDLALASELYTTGSLNIFAHQTNVNTDACILCYDIRELDEQLRPVGMVVTLDAIFNRVIRNWRQGKRTWILADEFYILFRYSFSAEFFYRLFKRMRKYNAFITAISQNVDEILRSDTARLMLANSELLVMLNQAATDREELAKLLNISENQLSYITNVPAGHGIIRCGGAIIPFENSFPKNTKLYRLMTTKPNEKFL